MKAFSKRINIVNKQFSNMSNRNKTRGAIAPDSNGGHPNPLTRDLSVNQLHGYWSQGMKKADFEKVALICGSIEKIMLDPKFGETDPTHLTVAPLSMTTQICDDLMARHQEQQQRTQRT
jgi:hypothetical protein